MIESEARQKWCPFVRFHVRPSGVDKSINNRVTGMDDDPLNTLCIASDCMAWRWIPEVKMPHEQADNEGYRGLAGKP